MSTLHELTEKTPIVVAGTREAERFLRRTTTAFDPDRYPRKELHAMVRTMRKIMKRSQGIGLSANQVGINLNFCVVEPPKEEGKARVFYALGNPVILKRSIETIEGEEGCLSVPETYGAVPRHAQVTVEGIDIHGRTVRVKARGLLARIFQHEIDHLNGVLFTDKTKELHPIPASERLKERRGAAG